MKPKRHVSGIRPFNAIVKMLVANEAQVIGRDNTADYFVWDGEVYRVPDAIATGIFVYDYHEFQASAREGQMPAYRPAE